MYPNLFRPSRMRSERGSGGKGVPTCLPSEARSTNGVIDQHSAFHGGALRDEATRKKPTIPSGPTSTHPQRLTQSLVDLGQQVLT